MKIGKGAFVDEIAQKVLRFESFSLDVMRRILRSGDHDVDLRPKSFDVLCCLVANAGRIVRKEEIIEAVWPDVVVTNELLTRCVSDVRLALGDAEQRIIKTVPRRGYLFAAPLSQVSANELSSGTEHLFWRKHADILRPDRPSIAILPFANIGGDQQDYFSDGISGDLTTSLSRFSDLFVIARDSAFKYKGRRIDPKQVGRELGVRYLLQGDIRSDG